MVDIETVEAIDQRRALDAKRFAEHDPNLCMICGDQDLDRRSLFLDCFYNIKEAVPEAIDLADCSAEVNTRGFYLRICKDCRSELLQHLRDWRNESFGIRCQPPTSHE